MKKMLFSLVLLLMVVSGCSDLQTEWVRQDRDYFREIDGAGLDRWIDTDLTMSSEKKNALRLLNAGRRARIKRGCQAAGIPEEGQ